MLCSGGEVVLLFLDGPGGTDMAGNRHGWKRWRITPGEDDTFEDLTIA